jgi:type III restriction enzyme
MAGGDPMTSQSVQATAANPASVGDSPGDDPVLNGPYDPPTRYFEIGPKGPTGVIFEGRRPSESFIPVAKPKKRTKNGTKSESQQLELTFRPE